MSINALIAIIIINIYNYLFLLNVLKRTMLEMNIVENYKLSKWRYLYTGIPFLVMGIVFTFVNWVPVNSFGTALFWGSVVFVLYNITINKVLLGREIVRK